MDANIDPMQWPRWKDAARARWSKLSDADLAYIQGNAELGAIRLKERYGLSPEEAQHQWEQFRRSGAGDGAEAASDAGDASGP